MLRNRQKKTLNGQVILEYALVIGAVVLAMIAMSTMVRRASQSMVKTVADQIGNQINAEQKFDEGGHLEYSYSSSRTNTNKNVNEFVGNTTYTHTDVTDSDGNTLINLGFTQEYN